MVYFVPACVWPGSWVDFESCSCIGACAFRAYAWVCMPIHVYVCVQMHARQLGRFRELFMYRCVHLSCVCMRMHAYTCTYMRANACIRMHVHLYACLCDMHAYASICMHTSVLLAACRGIAFYGHGAISHWCYSLFTSSPRVL